MPFFEIATDIAIDGGEFNDVRGNLNRFDYSHNVLNNHSHNNNTTTIIDSNNDSSIRTYIGTNPGNTQRFQSPGDLRHIEAQNCKKEMDTADQVAMLIQIEHALGWRPIPLSQHQPSRNYAATGREVYNGLCQAENPFAQMIPSRQPLQQNTDPFPISSTPGGFQYKSNNPFKSVLKMTDPDLRSRSFFQH